MPAPQRSGRVTLEVFTVTQPAHEEGRAYWCRIGSAWKNSDDSLTVKLNALPVNGELVIKKPRPPQAT